MNTTFSFNRLVLMLKRYFIENKNKEIMYWGILILVFTLVHKAETAKSLLYIMGFIFAAKQFKIFAYTPGGMHYLLIPATHLEKLISNIILTTVYFFIMILLTYSIGNFIGTNLYNLIFNHSDPVTWEFFNSANTHSLGNNFNLTQENGFLDMFITFLTIQSIFMLGSVYFKRGAMGRTWLVIFAFSILIGIMELIILKGLFGGISTMRNMNSISIMTNGSTTITIIENGFKIFSYLLIPYLWLVTYFRLTEKQV
jgi:hypothetical protein